MGVPLPCKYDSTEGHHAAVGIPACGGDDSIKRARGGGEICSLLS